MTPLHAFKTIKYLIFNPKTRNLLLFLAYTRLNKFYKFNKLSLRISSIILVTTFSTIWLEFHQSHFTCKFLSHNVRVLE